MAQMVPLYVSLAQHNSNVIRNMCRRLLFIALYLESSLKGVNNKVYCIENCDKPTIRTIELHRKNTNK